MEKRLKVGELVWAKIRGFPWWPGVIGKIKEGLKDQIESKVKVFFIGDSTHAEVCMSKVENFEQKYSEFSKTKKHSLLKSIEIANQIQKGKVVFNNHLNSENKKKQKNNIEQEIIPNQSLSIKLKQATIPKESLLNQKRRRITFKKKLSQKGKCRKKLNDPLNKEINPSVLERNIQELVFLKIELPSSMTKDSMLATLDKVHSIIELLEDSQLFQILESIKNLMVFLLCLCTNKNEALVNLAVTTTKLIKEKIFRELFNAEITNLTKNPENENEAELSELFKKVGKEVTPVNNNVLNNKRRRRKGVSNSESKDKIKEEITISDISLNSDKTDCDEVKYGRHKIAITPLDKLGVFAILKDFFSESNSFEELDHSLRYGNLHSSKPTLDIKNHYMRKRVCLKFYKVLYILLKKMKLEKDKIKNLSVYLEFKGRESDPEMSDKYRHYISSIFNKIKMKVMNTSYIGDFEF